MGFFGSSIKDFVMKGQLDEVANILKRDKNGMKKLIRLLGDGDPKVRNATVVAMIKIGEPVVFGLSEYFHIYYDEEKLFYKNNFITKESKEVLIWVCRSLGKESIKSILASSILYHGSSGYERTEMEDEKVDALVELGEKEDVVSPLIQLLDSEASKKMPSVSRVAVRVLGKIGGQQAFDSLFKFYLSSRWPSSDFLSYRSPSSDLQRLTIFALGKIDLKKALSLVNFEYERVKGAKVDNPHYIAIIWLQHIKTLFETGQYDIKEDWWIIDTLNEVSFKDELRYRLNM